MSNKVLVVGANGMLGGSLFRYLSKLPGYEVLGTVRSSAAKSALSQQGFSNTVFGVDVTDLQSISSIIGNFRPHYVLNCVGIIKQLDASKAPIPSITINSLLPHQLAELCDTCDARLVHFSTDCVFLGRSGLYKESDNPDAADLYGRSKLLGEVDYGRHLTLRTSIIGHELGKSLSLVDWFLSQNSPIKGYRKAIFSGMPTICVAEFLNDHVFGKELSGLYHLSVEPIDKNRLLQLINNAYSIGIEIIPFDDFVIDRSLNSDALRAVTGFKPLPWPQLINKMREEYLEYFA
ncbi:MAG: SDR family oxidoreductase [Endozoicomonas sp. (ex Botrylloides leachii)]|nr:SDR family oxidoreductase [Endozoicomonas sp. (ex Botrylloides leachii)]